MFMKQNDLLVVIGVAVIVLIAAGIFIAYPSQKSPYSPSQISDSPAGTREAAPAITASDSVAAADIPPKISREQATVLVREDYSEYTYSIARISLTDQYVRKPLYVVELAPVTGSIAERNETVFIDATTGDYYNPAQENAKISIERTKDLAREAFPQLSPDRIRMKFSDGSQYVRG
jgi:hypothetical protein